MGPSQPEGYRHLELPKGRADILSPNFLAAAVHAVGRQLPSTYNFWSAKCGWTDCAQLVKTGGGIPCHVHCSWFPARYWPQPT
jgi:hypothetical protein